MSIEGLLMGKALDSISPKGLEEAIVLLQQSILEQIRRIPQNQIFLKSGLGNTLSSNVADGVLIMAGFPIPAGFRGALEDFNVNFTTAAGTVRIVILVVIVQTVRKKYLLILTSLKLKPLKT